MSRKSTIARLAVGLVVLAASVAAYLVSASAAHACRPNPAFPVNYCDTQNKLDEAEETAGETLDPAPTNPYCDMYNPQPGRGCVTVKKDFVFQAIDNSDHSTNLCTVTLEGSAPEDQTDYANRPDVQYRSSIKCQKALQNMTIRPALYTATGEYKSSAPEFKCHILVNPCPISASTGSRGLQDGPMDYRQTTYVRLVLPGGPDPWIATEGRPGNPDHPESCTGAYEKGYVVECLLDLDIPATPPA
jgi:hypothetical protein